MDIDYEKKIIDNLCGIFGAMKPLSGKPRVLHIGNIANNAYLNAKILNRNGWDCDVLCCNYYHIMGCPEWEDADFCSEIKDHFFPEWSQVELNGFHTPPWFSQGPLAACLEYLNARRENKKILAWFYQILLKKVRELSCSLKTYEYESFTFWGIFQEIYISACSQGETARLPGWLRCLGRVRYLVGRAHKNYNAFVKSISNFRKECVQRISNFPKEFVRRISSYPKVLVRNLFNAPLLAFYLCARVLVKARSSMSPRYQQSFTTLCRNAINMAKSLLPPRTQREPKPVREVEESVVIPMPPRRISEGATRPGSIPEPIKWFREEFPERGDQLDPDDFLTNPLLLSQWEKIFKFYDIIIGYSTDGQYPMLCRKKPYFAYEHGTIRDIPFQTTAQGRLCALTYRKADVSFITNCDCIDSARKLELKNFRFVPHPVNEDIMLKDEGNQLREALRSQLDSDFIVFHPPRQHWEECRDPSWEKGNDIFIRGFARFVKEVNPKACAVFVEWGLTIEESKVLLASLGVADRVLWVAPQPNRRMIQYICATDLLADQFYLGAFGSTMPKALLHGCPAMLYLDESRHKWCFPEMPPVLNTRTDEEVFEALVKIYTNPEFARSLVAKGKDWYQRYHSNRVIADVFAEAAASVMSGND